MYDKYIFDMKYIYCGVGNYDTFMKTVRENEVIQAKKYEKEQDDIKHIKEFIASCGAHTLSACHCSSLRASWGAAGFVHAAHVQGVTPCPEVVSQDRW